LGNQGVFRIRKALIDFQNLWTAVPETLPYLMRAAASTSTVRQMVFSKGAPG
jgi:hypothetical protein